MEMVITSASALWFLPFAVPISIWVAWSDMKFMKIPNMAVLALFGVFVIVGLIALPLDEYLQRLLHLVVVLVIGFVISALGLIGAGDAKFAAVMAPFVALGDTFQMGYLLAAIILAAFVTHRLFQRSKAFRKLTPNWESWDNKDFPMGLALGSALVIYLALGVAYGA
ncbi:MAG: prepilin peptidase [Marinosulfonomonas sp.]|nr:prepilin peptidase [Marinosulfonomonas sp.]